MKYETVTTEKHNRERTPDSAGNGKKSKTSTSSDEVICRMFAVKENGHGGTETQRGEKSFSSVSS